MSLTPEEKSKIAQYLYDAAYGLEEVPILADSIADVLFNVLRKIQDIIIPIPASDRTPTEQSIKDLIDKYVEFDTGE